MIRDGYRICRHIVSRALNIRNGVRSLRWLPPFLSDYRLLSRQARSSNGEFPFGKSRPCLVDRIAESGTAKGHYFHQDLLVAQWLFEDQPQLHVDVGSRIDGFVAHVATFRELQVFDVRPQDSQVRNITFRQADFSAEEFELSEYCDSASCLHTLEHFGLGRYGDPVDYYGYRKGWKNLHRILQPGGRLYFSVPMGPQRIEFNAHRIFSIPYLRSMIDPLYDIERFAIVDDSGDLDESVSATDPRAEDSFGCRYGLAIFCLLKR